MTANDRAPSHPGRLTRRRLLGVLGGAGLLAGGMACSSTQSTPTAIPTAVISGAPVAPTAPAAALPSPTAAVRSPKRGGRFRLGITSAWPNLDPHQTASASVFGFGIGVCYSRLLKFKLRDVPQPSFIPTADVAASWDQPDDLTYVFKLRPNAKWQNTAPVNGRPLVAEDVRYSFDRQRTKGYPNASILEAIAKLDVVDPTTLRITTSAPSADFLVNIAAPQSVIVAREAVELTGDLKAGPLIGSGPFIVTKADPTGTSLAQRNPDFYFAGLPYVDTYELTIAADNEPLKAAFRSGNLEIMPGLTQEEVDVIRKAKPDVNLQMVKGLGSGTEFGLKLDRPPFNDLRVRRAVYKAIDPETIIKTVFGTGWLTVGLPLPSVEWALPQDEIGRLYKRDLEGARQLLKEASLENGLDFTLTVATNNAFFPPAGELIAAQLREAGLRVTIKPVDGATFSAQVQDRGEFEAYVGAGVTTPSADAALFGKYHSKGSRNPTKVNDAKLDQMIERQTTLVRSADERKKLLLDIQRYIIDQGYVRFFHSFDAPLLTQTYVRDYFPGYGALNLETDKWVQVWLDM